MSVSASLCLCLHWGSSCSAASPLFWCLFTTMLDPQVRKSISAGELRHQSASRHQPQFSTFTFCYGVVSNGKRFCALYVRRVQVDLPLVEADFVSCEHSQEHGKPVLPRKAERQSTDVWIWCLRKFMVSRKCVWDLSTSAKICACINTFIQVLSTVGRARGHLIGKPTQQID